VASACVCANLFTGCRGLGKGRSLRLYPNSARLWSGPMHFLGTHLGLRPRPAGRCALPAPSAYECACASAGCLRPKAEFARSSGRGIRWVKKGIVAPCITLQGVSDPQGSCNSNRSLCARSWIQDAKEMCNNIHKQPGAIARHVLFLLTKSHNFAHSIRRRYSFFFGVFVKPPTERKDAV
jgi:hypothetical protein